MIIGILAALGGPETAVATQATVESANQIVKIGQAFGVKPWLLLAQVSNFGLVASLLYFFVIKPIQGQLDARAKLIDEGLKRSEESAKILAEANAQKDSIITGARREAQSLTERTQKEMQAFEAARRQQAQQEAAQIAETAARNLQLAERQQLEASERKLAEIVVTLAEKSLAEDLTADQKSRFAARVGGALGK